MRVTQKYLLNWLKAKFQQLEIDFIPYEIHKTYCTSNQYEAGAAHFLINAHHKDSQPGQLDATILVPFPLREYQRYLNDGHVLVWEPRIETCGMFIDDSCITYRKK